MVVLTGIDTCNCIRCLIKPYVAKSLNQKLEQSINQNEQSVATKQFSYKNGVRKMLNRH